MGKLLNLLQDLLLLYVEYGGPGGSERADLSASISYHIKIKVSDHTFNPRHHYILFSCRQAHKNTPKNDWAFTPYSQSSLGKGGRQSTLLLPSIQEKATLLSYKGNK